MGALSPEEIRSALASLPGWEVRDGVLARTFQLAGGFGGSIAFVNRLAAAANAADHHPDLAIVWDRVTVTLVTHSEGGITAKDVAMAHEADRLAAGA